MSESTSSPDFSSSAAPPDDLFRHVYDELRRLARVVRRGRAPASLNTTALVHEAYLHLKASDVIGIENKTHFMRLAARAMRQVIAHEVRHRGALKRGGDAVTVAFEEGRLGTNVPVADLVTLEHALTTLDRVAPRQVRVVECRFYAGLTVEETADALGVSASTVKRDWRAARAWLSSRINASD